MQFDEKLIEFSRVCFCATPYDIWRRTTDPLDVSWLICPSALSPFPTSCCRNFWLELGDSCNFDIDVIRLYTWKWAIFIHSLIHSVRQSVIPVYCWHRTPYYQETRDLKTTRGHLVEPAETPVLWIVPFAWKWTRPFWQKWTCPRGHRAGLWPSWLAGLLASRCWHETDIETAGQTKRKHNVPDLGYDAQSLRGVKSHTGMHLIDMIAPKYIKIQHKLELKANCICPEVMLGRCREKNRGLYSCGLWYKY